MRAEKRLNSSLLFASGFAKIGTAAIIFWMSPDLRPPVKTRIQFHFSHSENSPKKQHQPFFSRDQTVPRLASPEGCSSWVRRPCPENCHGTRRVLAILDLALYGDAPAQAAFTDEA